MEVDNLKEKLKDGNLKPEQIAKIQEKINKYKDKTKRYLFVKRKNVNGTIDFRAIDISRRIENFSSITKEKPVDIDDLRIFVNGLDIEVNEIGENRTLYKDYQEDIPKINITVYQNTDNKDKYDLNIEIGEEKVKLISDKFTTFTKQQIVDKIRENLANREIPLYVIIDIIESNKQATSASLDTISIPSFFNKNPKQIYTTLYLKLNPFSGEVIPKQEEAVKQISKIKIADFSPELIDIQVGDYLGDDKITNISRIDKKYSRGGEIGVITLEENGRKVTYDSRKIRGSVYRVIDSNKEEVVNTPVSDLFDNKPSQPVESQIDNTTSSNKSSNKNNASINIQIKILEGERKEELSKNTIEYHFNRLIKLVPNDGNWGNYFPKNATELIKASQGDYNNRVFPKSLQDDIKTHLSNNDFVVKKINDKYDKFIAELKPVETQPVVSDTNIDRERKQYDIQRRKLLTKLIQNFYEGNKSSIIETKKLENKTTDDLLKDNIDFLQEEIDKINNNLAGKYNEYPDLFSARIIEDTEKLKKLNLELNQIKKLINPKLLNTIVSDTNSSQIGETVNKTYSPLLQSIFNRGFVLTEKGLSKTTEQIEKIILKSLNSTPTDKEILDLMLSKEAVFTKDNKPLATRIKQENKISQEEIINTIKRC